MAVCVPSLVLGYMYIKSDATCTLEWEHLEDTVFDHYKFFRHWFYFKNYTPLTLFLTAQSSTKWTQYSSLIENTQTLYRCMFSFKKVGGGWKGCEQLPRWTCCCVPFSKGFRFISDCLLKGAGKSGSCDVNRLANAAWSASDLWTKHRWKDQQCSLQNCVMQTNLSLLSLHSKMPFETIKLWLSSWKVDLLWFAQ